MSSSWTRGLARMVVVGILALGWIHRAAGQPTDTGQRVVAIEFRCDAPIDRQGLVLVLPFRVGDILEPGALDLARHRLAQTQIFTEIAVTAEPRGDGVAVVARLTRKAILNAVHFQGNETLSDKELLRATRLREGVVLTEEVREYALSRLRGRYAAEGFESAEVSAGFTQSRPGELDVTFSIDEGAPVRIAAIELEEPLPLPADEIRAVLEIKAGDRYVREDRRKAQAAVTRLFRQKGYYEVGVDVEWERKDHDGVLRFKIEPGPPFEIQFVGNRQLSSKRLLGLMDLETRPIVTDGTWRELARRIRRAYQEAGYYTARVELHSEPGPPKRLRFEVTEGVRFHVAEVTFDGNRVLPADRLIRQMATRPPSWIPWRRGIFLDDVFDEDLKRLWFFYREQGFQDAQIVDARKRLDDQRGKMFVTVVIEEGRRTIVRKVARVGMEVIADRLPELVVAVGEPLNPDQVEADRRALLGALAEAGYTRAQVKAEVSTRHDGATDAATVTFTADPGERQHVGTIIVQNDLETRWRVILRELPFKQGDPLNPDALLRGQGAVYKLGLFRSVTVRPLDTAADKTTHDIAVSVPERPPGTLQWGTGYNTRDGFRGFLEVGYNNLQGLARRLSLRGEFSLEPSDPVPNEYIGSLGFREPHIGDTDWSFRSNLLAQRSTRSVDQFSLERFAFIPAIERSLLPGFRVGVEFQAEQSQVFDVASDVLAFNPRDEGRLRTISLSPLAVYDGRDDAFVPHRGVFDSARLKVAPGQFGSDVPFLKLTAQHSQYIPLTDDLTFVYAARGGWARAYEGSDQVPIRERFFLGGRTTVRGFSENSIGPEGSLGDPLGGDLFLNLNTELRFPLIFGVQGAVFVDGGGVYLQDRTISIHDFRRSTGLGLRYITPVGPISLDYGFKLDRRTGESLGEIHFSIGTIF